MTSYRFPETLSREEAQKAEQEAEQESVELGLEQPPHPGFDDESSLVKIAKPLED